MKNRNKLFVFLLVSSLFLFSCQALSATPTIIPTSEPLPPPATSIPEQVVIESPVTSETDATEFPIEIGDELRRKLLVDIYERVNPGVVAILVLTVNGNGLGSGFVIDKEGHILTNYHVIEGVSEVEVDFPSGL